MIFIILAVNPELSDFSVFGNRIGNNVNRIIDAFVHAFDSVCDENLPLKKLTVIDARKAFDFLDELVGFVLRDEF